MPIYEYRCDSCDRVFEALQRVSDDPLAECRHCGGPVKKLISSPAIQFLGSGWYLTDYARKGQMKGSESGDGASSSAKEGGSKDGSKDGGDSKGAGSSGSGDSGSSSKPAGEARAAAS